MANNRLGEMPWLIDTDTGRPNGVRTQRGEELQFAPGFVQPSTSADWDACVLFGDSINVINGGPNIGNGLTNYDRAWVMLASAQLGGKLNIVWNASISGNNTAQMLARLETDVTPNTNNARFCIFNGGVNDILGGTGTPQTFAQSRTNMMAIVSRLREMFPIVVWCTPTPYASSATVAAQSAQLADFVRQTAPTLPGVLLCDNYAQIVNKTATTGDMVTGYSNDTPQLHPNMLGARLMAAELAAVLTPYLSGSAPLPASQANTVANLGAAYATQVLPNPLLVNNGGTISGNVTSAGAGGLAGAPLDWTVRETGAAGITVATCQLVARADGFGNDVQVVASAGSVAGLPIIELLSATRHAEVSPGQKIQGVFTLSASGMSGVKKIVLYMVVTDSNGSTTLQALGNDGTTFSQADMTNFVFKTKVYTLGTGITQLRLRVDISGNDKNMAGTFKLGKPVINILPA